MTTADPTTTAPQPAPLDLDLIEARWNGTCNCEDQEAHGPDCRQGHGPGCDADCYSRYGCAERLVAEVRRLRAELDAPSAPTTYALPAEPPGPLWDNIGRRWDRSLEGGWQHVIGKGERRSSLHMAWHDLLDFVVSLSTVPPAGTEGDRG